MNGDREGPSAQVTARMHRGRSIQSIALAAGCRLVMKNAIRLWGLNPGLNWPVAAIDSAVGMMPRIGDTTTTRVKLRHCDAEFVGATDTSAARAVLYIHGGGFLLGGLNTHRALITRISKAADAAVLTSDIASCRITRSATPCPTVWTASDGWCVAAIHPKGLS